MDDKSNAWDRQNKRVPKRVLEKHGFTTQRQFKQHFRKKLSVLKKAVNDFVSYSAYIPRDTWHKTLDVSASVNCIAEQLSQKNWGR